MPISNAKDTPLGANSGTVPNVSGAMQGWFQPMQFTRVTKTVENFVVVETAETINFRGVWQPLSARQLSMKPEGQRSWKWFKVHAEIGTILVPDEVITYLGNQYRVEAHADFSLYGFVDYDLVEDFTGSGPT